MSSEAPTDSLAQRMSYGPGMRWQRLVEGLFMITALLTRDVRWAWVPFVSVLLQIISFRLALVTLAVATFYRPRTKRRMNGVYSDPVANRGGAVISAIVQSLGIYLIGHGHSSIGWLLLALPAGSFVLSPSVGFCVGCILFVNVRMIASRLGLVSRSVEGRVDVDFETKLADDL